jgi:RNA polymerase sigma-54 factor
MRQGLQLKISQQLTMTPQLQQAIRLLQLSTLDLRQEMIEQLYNNPLLEMDEDAPESTPNQDADRTTSESNQVQEAERNSEQNPEYEWNDEIPKDVPVDANWDDVYSPPTNTSNSGGGEVNLEQVYQLTESFQGHLEWQLNLTPFSDRDREIAAAFIDSIDSSGFISAELSDITAHIHYDEIEDQLHEDELVAVLHRLQQFDPPGVFARSISECLTIQLNQLAPETEHLHSAKHLVLGFLQDIASVDNARLGKKSGLDTDQLQGALQLVRSLNPRPGEALSSNDVEYIVPDAYVEKINGRWRVKLNDSNMPRLRINDSYSSLIKRSDSSDQNQFLKENLAEARWFLRSIESRNETLMRVAMTIIELQRGFLDHGPVAMKPMVLSDIASKLELHESTAVCAILKELIGAEQSAKPLSDSKLTSLLEQQGIQVARRTVAKYRESLGIPSSSQRKRF